jgi:hypothetical protein
MESVLQDNAEVLRECEKHGVKYVLIEEEYPEEIEQYIV